MSWGLNLGWVWKPIDRVGVYVPGGKASYPSSAIMNIVPARVAGVEDIMSCYHLLQMGPYNPLTIYTSTAMNIRKIMRLGGAKQLPLLLWY